MQFKEYQGHWYCMHEGKTSGENLESIQGKNKYLLREGEGDYRVIGAFYCGTMAEAWKEFKHTIRTEGEW